MNPSDAAIAAMHWCDVYLSGISWSEDGRDLVLDFLMPPARRKLRLTCRWARGLRVTLDFSPDTMGFALSWDGQITRQEDGSRGVALDFGSAGQLSLVCDEVELSGEALAGAEARTDSPVEA